jgi:hypothetical protein
MLAAVGSPEKLPLITIPARQEQKSNQMNPAICGEEMMCYF